MNHPLTDDTCNELSIFPIKALDDKYAGLMMADMRAAADWQLKQVIEQWEEVFNSPNMTDTQVIREFYTRLHEMRPQED